MSSKVLRDRSCGALTLLFLIATPLLAQNVPASGGQSDKSAGAPQQRRVFPLIYAQAAEIEGSLREFFNDANVQIVPDSTTNSLLVRSPASQMEEFASILGKLDRKLAGISVEILVASLNASQLGAEKDKLLASLSGPADEVWGRVRGLEMRGVLSNLEWMKATVRENRPQEFSRLVNVPVVVGVSMTQGRVAKNTIHQSVGTKVSISPRTTPDGSVLLDLDITNSRIHTAPDAVSIGKDETGAPILIGSTINSSLKHSVLLTPGQAVLQGTLGPDATQTLVIISARLESRPDAR